MFKWFFFYLLCCLFLVLIHFFMNCVSWLKLFLMCLVLLAMQLGRNWILLFNRDNRPLDSDMFFALNMFNSFFLFRVWLPFLCFLFVWGSILGSYLSKFFFSCLFNLSNWLYLLLFFLLFYLLQDMLQDLLYIIRNTHLCCVMLNSWIMPGHDLYPFVTIISWDISSNTTLKYFFLLIYRQNLLHYLKNYDRDTYFLNLLFIKRVISSPLRWGNCSS